MKKIVAILSSLGIVSGASIAAVSCGKNNDIIIELVPSQKNDNVNEVTATLSNAIHDALSKVGITKKVKFIMASDYNTAALAVNAGTAALAFLPTSAYSQNIGKGMHQFLSSSRIGFQADYSAVNGPSTTFDDDGNLVMNIEGAGNQNYSDMYLKIVQEFSTRTKSDQIQNEDIQASYYRSLMYVSNDYFTSTHLSEKTWSETIKDLSKQDYAKLVWNVVSKSIDDQKFGLSTEKTSGAGRIYPIQFLIQTYLEANKTDDVQKAKENVEKLLKGNIQEIKDYGTESITHLNDKTFGVAISYADGRVQPKDDKATNYNLENINVLGASKGILNDGIVYSSKHFKNNNDELIKLQNAFLDTQKDNDDFKQAIKDLYSYSSFVRPMDDITDNDQMTNYEKNTIQAIYDGVDIKAAKEIANEDLVNKK